MSSKPWSGEAETGDCCKWMHYADERRELANMIKDVRKPAATALSAAAFPSDAVFIRGGCVGRLEWTTW